MKEKFYDVIKNEFITLTNQKNYLKKCLVASDGCYLEIKKNKGRYIQYYRCSRSEDGKVKREFIPKDNKGSVIKIAQCEYDRKLMRDINKRLAIIEPVVDYYEKNDLKQVYEKLSSERKKIIDSHFFDEKQKFIGY